MTAAEPRVHLLGRAALVDHDRRPQAHRGPVRDQRPALLRRRRSGGAHHPPAARFRRRHGRGRGHVQPALHHARDHHGIPGPYATLRRALQLHDPAHDRRARRRIPPTQRVQLLDLPVRQPAPQSLVLRRQSSGRWVVRVRQPHIEAVQPRDGDRFLAVVGSDHGHRVDRLGGQLHGHDPQHAGARHVAHADAAIRLDGADRSGADAAGVPSHHGGIHLPHVRPLLRDALLHSRRGRDADPLAAPVLDLRTSRGLHPDPAFLRRGVGGPADVLAQAPVRGPVHDLLGYPHRLSRIRRVEPSYVRDRPGGGRRHGVLVGHDADRDPHRREDLQLDRHPVGRPHPLQDATLLRGRHGGPVHHRGPLRHHARFPAGRHPAARHLFRGRASPLRLLRGHRVRSLRRGSTTGGRRSPDG